MTTTNESETTERKLPYGAVPTPEATGRGFVSADDSLAYAQKAKEDKTEETTEATVDASPEEETSKYNKAEDWRTWKKRRDDIKRHHDTKMNEMNAKIRELEKQLTEATQSNAFKTPEELATFKEQYGDEAAIMETIAHQTAMKQVNLLRKQLEDVQIELLTTKQQKAESELRSLVSNWDEIKEDEDFHEWLGSQPETIQDWIYRNSTDATLAARAVKLYQAETGKISSGNESSPKQKKRDVSGADAVSVKASATPSVNEPKIWTKSEIAALSLNDFEKHKSEIQKALQEGRIRPG